MCWSYTAGETRSCSSSTGKEELENMRFPGSCSKERLRTVVFGYSSCVPEMDILRAKPFRLLGEALCTDRSTHLFHAVRTLAEFGCMFISTCLFRKNVSWSAARLYITHKELPGNLLD